MKPNFRSLILLGVVAVLAACGGGGGTVGTTATTPVVTPPVTTPTAVVGGVSLGTSLTAIATDGSSTATITATVVDANNNALSGISVVFTTDNGFLTNATSPTGTNGTATVVLQNGSADFSNRTANVTVTAGTKTATIPVLLSGSTLTLAPSANTTTVGGAAITFTATARSSAPASAGVNNQSVRFSIGAASTGSGTLSAVTGTTGPTGIAPSTGGTVVPISLTPTAAGTVVVVAEWLNAAGAVSVTASQTVTVTAPGIDFAVTNPAVSPSSLTLGSTQAFSVTVPTIIAGSVVANVRLAANAGKWSNNSAIVTTVVASNLVNETYTPSANAGNVTVTIEALSAANVTLATISQTLAVSAPASSAASVSLQAAATTLTPSSGSNLSTTTLTATVRNLLNAAVGGAPVLFELLNTTGTGESVSPAVAYTDSTGVATATFTAGNLATLGAIYVRASVVGQPACTTNPPAVDPVATCKSVALLVNTSAVSITIGLSSLIAEATGSLGTAYSYPGSVLVVDNNGAPVANKTVTLTLFPVAYNQGSVSGATGCQATYTNAAAVLDGNGNPVLDANNNPVLIVTPLVSEDTNRNGVLDPGEDTSGNGSLSPITADGGAVPATITTNAAGLATFEITYPKTSGNFVQDELTARITASGTEGQAKTTFWLPISAADAAKTPGCPIAGSRPFP